MNYKQLNLSIPDSVYQELKKWVPKGKVTEFMLKLTEAGLNQLKFQKAADRSYGAWAAGKHPELAKGTRAYLRNLRRGR